MQRALYQAGCETALIWVPRPSDACEVDCIAQVHSTSSSTAGRSAQLRCKLSTWGRNQLSIAREGKAADGVIHHTKCMRRVLFEPCRYTSLAFRPQSLHRLRLLNFTTLSPPLPSRKPCAARQPFLCYHIYSPAVYAVYMLCSRPVYAVVYAV